MAIQKYQDSFGDMMPQSFSSMLDRFFQDSMAGRGRVSAFSPQVDAYETEKGYEIEVALPGLKREDIKVDFHQGRLTVSGERQFKSEQNDRRYHIVESSYGSFNRSFQLPDTVEPRQIQATFEDGVLRVTVPKNEEKTMRHQIQVLGGQSGTQSPASGQMSERLGQQATDVPVQNAEHPGTGRGATGKQAKNQPQPSMN
ncbi:Hsp20/alpha crystallin family protein [Hymenobacter sp. BT523]|uniref:Hsp20/alpha crystallin family protein n=1 Tax=Hymenobacter sp. BT523 TaxID=2795725 RepID=UPI0018ED6C48|nr:Hsp20/alpha crystallin family protein [Hymenobacter sp. BT523]MBJ6107943.1 Hsp20/alpha crystallin family protein [Hymenobacter sp. BT523]